MEREEFSNLVKGMKAVYSDPKFITDRDAFNVWYEMLKDIPYMICQASVHKYMATNKFPPTIADIRQGAMEITEEKELNEGEAWSLVYKAISNASYRAKEEFEKLPEDCQRAIGSPAILKEWASMDIGEVNTVIQSNFMRSYKVERKRSKELAQLPSVTRDLIAKVVESTKLIGKETKND